MKTCKRIIIPVLLLLSMSITSCDALRNAAFDQHAYEEAISIKVDAVNLMEKANEPYANYQEEVETLFLEVQKIIEYEKHRENNEISLAMWQLLNNEERNLLAGYFKRWEAQGTMNVAFMKEATTQVSEALDALIAFESNKDKESKQRLLDIITSN